MNPIVSDKILRYSKGKVESFDDRLAVEFPLEIRVNKVPYVVLMCSPNKEKELGVGFCLTEGVIETIDDISFINLVKRDGGTIIYIRVIDERSDIIKPMLERKIFKSATSCGICGKTSFEEVNQKLELVHTEVKVDIKTIFRSTKVMRENQKIFGETGATHSSGLFNSGGELISFAEDVGRHNSLDKGIGEALVRRDLGRVDFAYLSSRVSFEMMEKVIIAKIPIVVAVSAPTSKALELAKEYNITLIAFFRGDRFNIYCGRDRLEGIDI